MKKYPLVVSNQKGKILAIESNGDIYLRDKKIGNDKELAKILTAQGKAMSACLETTRKFNEIVGSEPSIITP